MDGFEVCNECGVVPSTGKRTIASNDNGPTDLVEEYFATCRICGKTVLAWTMNDLIKYWNLYQFGGDNLVFEGQALAYRLTFVNF